MMSMFGESQTIECVAYGTTAALVAALNRGFILVTFVRGGKKADAGTELSIQLAEPINTPSAEISLQGSCRIDGEHMSFEGTLKLAELKGSGRLRSVAGG